MNLTKNLLLVYYPDAGKGQRFLLGQNVAAAPEGGLSEGNHSPVPPSDASTFATSSRSSRWVFSVPRIW